VWYTGQFFALFFMTTILKVPTKDGQIIVAKALLLGMPLFVLFGWLSDRIGRKKIIMAGLLLAAVSYRVPGTNIGLYPAMQRAAGNNVTHVDSTKNKVTGATVLTPQTLDATGKAITAPVAAGANKNMLIFLVFIQVIFVTMVYGPIAAFLVESFPARIRYSALSLPYHIGNGVFGGLVPLVCVWIPAATGNPFDGLYYPIGIAALTFIVGSFLLRDPRDVKIWTEVAAPAPATGAARR
jgi:MFS family permease